VAPLRRVPALHLRLQEAPKPAHSPLQLVSGLTACTTTPTVTTTIAAAAAAWHQGHLPPRAVSLRNAYLQYALAVREGVQVQPHGAAKDAREEALSYAWIVRWEGGGLGELYKRASGGGQLCLVAIHLLSGLLPPHFISPVQDPHQHVDASRCACLHSARAPVWGGYAPARTRLDQQHHQPRKKGEEAGALGAGTTYRLSAAIVPPNECGRALVNARQHAWAW
jgi:hypothetical protein